MTAEEIDKQLEHLRLNNAWLDKKTKETMTLLKKYKKAKTAKDKKKLFETRKQLLELKARNLVDLRRVDQLLEET